MVIETKVYEGNQTTIPAEFRKRHNIKPNDIVEWKEDRNGNIYVNFRKKVNVEDVMGIIKLNKRTDAVQLKKKLYKHKYNLKE